MNNKNKLIDEWLFFATSDLKSEEASYEFKIYHIVCFHSQQAAEKILKALYILNNQEIPRTHDLLYLLTKSKSKDKIIELKEQLNLLNQFYVPTRYPEALPGSLPERLPDKKDAMKAIECAKEILKFMNGKFFKKKKK